MGNFLLLSELNFPAESYGGLQPQGVSDVAKLA